MGILLKERTKSAPEVQELFTRYGCEINTRLGLHAASSNSCSPDGLIILEFIDNADDKVKEFEKELKDLANVEVQKMIF